MSEPTTLLNASYKLVDGHPIRGLRSLVNEGYTPLSVKEVVQGLIQNTDPVFVNKFLGITVSEMLVSYPDGFVKLVPYSGDILSLLEEKFNTKSVLSPRTGSLRLTEGEADNFEGIRYARETLNLDNSLTPESALADPLWSQLLPDKPLREQLIDAVFKKRPRARSASKVSYMALKFPRAHRIEIRPLMLEGLERGLCLAADEYRGKHAHLLGKRNAV